MRLTAAIISLALFASAAHAADMASDIDRAVDLYLTDRDAAVGVLKDVYGRNSQYLFSIKARLAARQNYGLYRDFLGALPRTPAVLDEIVDLRLITSDTNGLISDLDDLFRTKKPSETVEKYSGLYVKAENARYLAGYLSNSAVFNILSVSHISAQKTAQMDSLLLGFARPEQVDRSNVCAYLSGSWIFRERDVSALIGLYSVGANPAMNKLLSVSYFIRGEYARAVSNVLAGDQSASREEKENRTIQADIPYCLSYSYFRLGDYKKALEYLDRAYFPWKYDPGMLRFLCCLGLNDPVGMEAALGSVNNADAREFFAAFMQLLGRNGATNGIQALERYTAAMERRRNYSLEATVLFYTFYRDRAHLQDVAGLVRQSLLFQDMKGLDGNPLSGEFAIVRTGSSGAANATSTNALVLAGFIRFRQAKELLLKGDKNGAREIFMALVQDAATPALIRSLAVYEARKL